MTILNAIENAVDNMTNATYARSMMGRFHAISSNTQWRILIGGNFYDMIYKVVFTQWTLLSYSKRDSSSRLFNSVHNITVMYTVNTDVIYRHETIAHVQLTTAISRTALDDTTC